MDLLSETKKMLKQIAKDDSSLVEAQFRFAFIGQPESLIDETCKALRENTKLKSLGLSSNELSDAQGAKFCEAIAKHKSLNSLDLSFNQFTHTGMKKLASILEQNTTITDIYIYSMTDLIPENVKLFENLTKRNMENAKSVKNNIHLDISKPKSPRRDRTDKKEKKRKER